MHMLRSIPLFLLCFFLTAALSFPPPAQPDFCELRGAVFIEEVAGFADYRVYVEEVEAFADLVVFREHTESFADEAGEWFITDSKSFADFSIYVEDVPAFADFSIAYTPYRTAAGCQ